MRYVSSLIWRVIDVLITQKSRETLQNEGSNMCQVYAWLTLQPVHAWLTLATHNDQHSNHLTSS